MFQRSFYKQYGGVDYSSYGIKINDKYYDSAGKSMKETDFFNKYDKSKPVKNIETKTDLEKPIIKKLENIIELGKGNLKLMTWNVFNFRSYGWNKGTANSYKSFNEQMKLIKEQNPDIISIQEVAFSDSTNTYPSSYIKRVDFINKLSEYNVYIKPFGGSGKLQNVIAVRKTIKSDEDKTTFNSGTYKIDVSKPVNVKATINGKEIIIIGFHLPIKDQGPNGEKTAAEKAENILEKVLKYCDGKNAIIMGDFNHRHKEIEKESLYKKGSIDIKLSNSDKTLFKKYNYTKPSGKTGLNTGEVIDMILWKGNDLSSTSSNKIIELDPPISDHNPVIQKIKIK